MTYQGKEVFTSDDFDYAAAKPGDYVEEAVVDAAPSYMAVSAESVRRLKIGRASCRERV